MSDERLGLPSASMADRMMNCPGSPVPGTGNLTLDSESANRGTNIHEALRTRSFAELNADEKRVYFKLLERRDRLVNEWAQSGEWTSQKDETRLYLRDAAMRPIFSGQPDEILTGQDSRIMVIDFKTGPVEAVESNWQLRAYAVLASPMRGAITVRAAVIQEDAEDVIDWTAFALDLFEAELRQGISQMRPEARRIAGHWCRFCPARGSCNQASVFAIAIRQEPGEQLTRVMTPWQIADVYRSRKAIVSILDEVERLMKAMTDEELAEVGFARKKNSPVREFTSIPEVVRALMDNGVSSADLLGSIKLSVGEAEKLLAEAKGLPKSKGKEALNELCSSFIAIKTRADSLEVAK